MQWTKRDWLILVSLIFLASILRLYKLGIIPPGFQFDEAFNGIDAYQVLEGNRPLFLPANAGREVLYTYWQALIILLHGMFTGDGPVVNVFTLRLGSAIGGLVAVPLIYTFLRLALKREAQAIALFVALAEALSLWHIHFSHYGIRVILMPVMFTGAFGLYWLASSRHNRRSQIVLYILSGVAIGLTVWNHPTGRFTPFVLLLYTAWIWFTTRSDRVHGPAARKHAIQGLLITGVVSFFVFLPLGLVFWERPDFFFAHVADSSVLNEEVYEGSPLKTILLNSLRVLGMFTVSGDMDWTHNLAGRPVFDPLMSLPFLMGLFLWGRRLIDKHDPDRNLLALLLIWLLIMLTPSVLSNDAPDYSRTMPAHPALMIAPGLGLAWLWGLSRHGERWKTLRKSGQAIAVAIVLISGGLAVYDYFVIFPTHEELYYVYDVDKLDALNTLAPLTQKNSVYLSELWAGHATSVFLRGQYNIHSIETSHTLVLPPPGAGLVYAFPDEQVERAEDLYKIFPDATLTVLHDPQDKALLHTVQIDAETAAQWPPEYSPTIEQTVRFEEGPTLLGMAPKPDGSILLFWQANERMLRNLTSFVHLVDPNGNRVGQVDKMPGSGSYGTPVWAVGERIIDRYWPTVVDPCSSGVEARVIVGWYEHAADGLRRPRTDGGGEIAQAGTMKMPLRSYPPEALIPEQSVAIAPNSMVTFVGYQIDSGTLEPGSPFTMDLLWEGDPGEEQFELSLGHVNDQDSADLPRDGGSIQGKSVLWSDTLGKDSDWEPGKRLCRRLFLRTPVEAQEGIYQLEIGVKGERASEIGALTIVPSTRRFTPPPSLSSSDMHFHNELDAELITLVGFDVEQMEEQVSEKSEEENEGRTVEVTLVWQASATIHVGYSAFVHVIDESGQMVAQSDAIPGNTPTNQWIPDEIIVDRHSLANLPMGPLQIVVGLYDPLNGRRLVVRDVEGRAIPDNAVELVTIE